MEQGIATRSHGLSWKAVRLRRDTAWTARAGHVDMRRRRSLLTSLKHGEGLRSCSSMAHLTDAWRMFPSYSRELWEPLGVPRERS